MAVMSVGAPDAGDGAAVVLRFYPLPPHLETRTA
jgi:hypothetical protein